MHPEVYGAAKSGEFHSLMTINLENGEDLFHQTTPKGNNVLHVAAQFRRVNFIREFLQDLSRSSLLWQDNCKGDTPLHVATQLGSHEMVRVFINRAKAIHQPDAYKELLRIPNADEDTLLHSAIRGHCKGVVELLIEEDPQLCDVTNAADESPLYLAVHQRFPDVIEPILCASSSPSSHKGPRGLTALHAAVRFLLPGCKKILEKRPELIREKDNNRGWTPLHYVSHFGKVDAVQLLLQHDTSVAYELDKEGDSALHIAAFQVHINVIDKLVTSYPDAWDIINFKRQTALHAAVIGGKVKVVKEYKSTRIIAIDKRVDRFATNKNGLIALDIIYAQDKMTFSRHRAIRALKGPSGIPSIQQWAVKDIKKRLDKQFLEDQPAASTTTRSDSSLKRIIELELLMAAFIATATFAAAFTMPGGYSNDGPNQGMATLAGRVAFKTFVITNTMAFTFSTMALFLQYDSSVLSVRAKAGFTIRAAGCIYIAMLGMVLAFASGYIMNAHAAAIGEFGSDENRGNKVRQPAELSQN
ncbi:ankyrin-1 [Eucalyptus grandis]|uniref:ankyrin-1 n=1 Tax=Eucalyptus grandis TaxID=71139 RepID=UPI00192ECDDE|nr:ankyrin-1 [Eucalyptus grandis]